jgi:hypothetical protein
LQRVIMSVSINATARSTSAWVTPSRASRSISRPTSSSSFPVMSPDAPLHQQQEDHCLWPVERER